MAIPDFITEIAIRAPGGPEVLVPQEAPCPVPGWRQALVAVKAAGINRPDVVQRQGLYPPPPGAPKSPGLEVAGTVVALGPGCERLKVGDAVTALVAGGGYASHAVVDEALALPVPAGLTFVEAAALPETFFTVWVNVFMRAHLKAGERFLVHGGTSGIGTTAIQLARHFGARVLATAGTDEKVAACLRLGAHGAFNYRSGDFAPWAKAEAGGSGLDVILDMVGGPYIPKNIEILADQGRHVSIAFLQGAKAEVNFAQVMMKRLTLTGSTLRPRSLAEKAAIARELETQVWPLIATGRVKPVIDQTFPLAQAAKAHARMEASEHIGKIVLTL